MSILPQSPTMRLICLLTLTVLALAGCGYKGPLFLPKPDQTSTAPQAKP
ncbi:lipoprotein [Chitinivorax sp. PXF-14]